MTTWEGETMPKFAELLGAFDGFGFIQLLIVVLRFFFSLFTPGGQFEVG